MSEEKHGQMCELPTTCGTCAKVFSWVCLRWCDSCGDAICPTCFPADLKDAKCGTAQRCHRCIAEDRQTRSFLAGQKMAMEREKWFLKGIMDEKQEADTEDDDDVAAVMVNGKVELQKVDRGVVKAGMIRRIKAGQDIIPPSRTQMGSMMVQLGDDVYVDAARVVSVLANGSDTPMEPRIDPTAGLFPVPPTSEVTSPPHVHIVWQEHEKQAAGLITACPTMAAARKLATEIQDRVNAGRFMIYEVDGEKPVSMDRLSRRQEEKSTIRGIPLLQGMDAGDMMKTIERERQSFAKHGAEAARPFGDAQAKKEADFKEECSKYVDPKTCQRIYRFDGAFSPEIKTEEMVDCITHHINPHAMELHIADRPVIISEFLVNGHKEMRCFHPSFTPITSFLGHLPVFVLTGDGWHDRRISPKRQRIYRHLVRFARANDPHSCMDAKYDRPVDGAVEVARAKDGDFMLIKYSHPSFDVVPEGERNPEFEKDPLQYESGIPWSDRRWVRCDKIVNLTKVQVMGPIGDAAWRANNKAVSDEVQRRAGRKFLVVHDALVEKVRDIIDEKFPDVPCQVRKDTHSGLIGLVSNSLAEGSGKSLSFGDGQLLVIPDYLWSENHTQDDENGEPVDGVRLIVKTVPTNVKVKSVEAYLSDEPYPEVGPNERYTDTPPNIKRGIFVRFGSTVQRCKDAIKWLHPKLREAHAEKQILDALCDCTCPASDMLADGWKCNCGAVERAKNAQ